MLTLLQIRLRDQPFRLLLMIQLAEAAGSLFQERFHDDLHLLDLMLTAISDLRI